MADLQFVVYIKAEAEALFATLTDPEQTPHFFMSCRIESSWESGAPVAFVETSRGPEGPTVVNGTVSAVEAPTTLAHTFAMMGQDDEPSTIRYALVQVPGAVKLVVDHTGLVDGSRTAALVAEAWPAILSSLKTWVETGEPLGLTQR